MIDGLKRILYLTEELESVRKKIDVAFKEYENAEEGSGKKYTAELEVMKQGKKAQRLKRKINNLRRQKKIS